MRRDPEFSTFAESCSWPDRPRRRAMEHFVNLPRDAAAFADELCPMANECVVSAIEKDLAVLSSSTATEQERLEALKYLGHSWRASTPIEWANESFLIAMSREVGYCIRTDGGCWYSEDNERLDDRVPGRTVQVDQLYIETHSPTDREQLVKAGVRLAGLLDQALGD